jgi:hypothetical protein
VSTGGTPDDSTHCSVRTPVRTNHPPAPAGINPYTLEKVESGAVCGVEFAWETSVCTEDII